MNVNYQEIARYMGVKNQPIDDKLKTDIDKCIIDIKNNINPLKLTAEYDIVHTENGVKLEGADVEFKGELIKNSLKGCKKIFILIATLTLEAEKMLSSYSSIDMYMTVVLDACLTYSIEEFCDNIEKELKDRLIQENLYATPRFSAGYGDFDISYQETIIRLTNAEKFLGIRVNSEKMLIPNKTVTAIIGISEKPKITINKKCSACNKNCIYRNND